MRMHPNGTAGNLLGPTVLVTAVSAAMATANFFLPVYLKNTLGFSGSQIGLIYAMFSVTTILAVVPVGLRNDRTSPRLLIGISLVMSAAGALGMALLRQFHLYLWVFLLYGLGLSAFRISTDALMFKTAGTQGSGLRWGIFNGFRMVAMGIGTFGTGYFLARWSFPAGLALLAGVMAASLVIPPFLSPVKIGFPRLREYVEDLSAPGILGFMAGLFLYCLHWGAEFTCYGLFLSETLGMGLSTMGWYMGAEFLMVAAACFWLGPRCDRGMDTTKAAIWGLLLSGIGQIFMCSPHFWRSLLWRSVHGFGDGLIVILIYLGVERLFHPDRVGGHNSGVTLVMMMGSFTGSLISGPLGAAFGYDLPLRVTGILVVALTLPLLRRRVARRSGSLSVLLMGLLAFAVLPACEENKPAPSPATPPAVPAWTAPSTYRIFPDDPPGSGLTARLSAARAEVEAFQITVNGGEDGLHSVNVTAGPLVGPEGAIGADRIRLFREYYVTVTKASFLGGVEGNPREPGEYPDPLIPFTDPYSPESRAVGAPFDVPARRNQPVWVEIDVPAEAAGGRYKGRMVVSAEGLESVEVEVELEVWGFAIPSQRNARTSYVLSWRPTQWYHGGPDGGWNEKRLKILQHYEDELHGCRIDTTNLTQRVSDPFHFDEHGKLLPVDWTEYDAAVGPRLDGSYFSDGVGAAAFNAGFFCPGSGDGMEALKPDQYKQAAAAFCAHLREKGWLDRSYVYVLDEPFWHPGSYARIAHDARLMLEADAGWRGRLLVTSWYVKDLSGLIGIWCPDTTYYENWFLGIPFPGRPRYAALRARGDELWFYVCDANWPPYAGYDIDTQLGFEPRTLMWQAWYEHASGFLYWSADFWQKSDPWGKLMNPETFGFLARNGDGFLLYPGDHDGTEAPAGSPEWLRIDGPIPSIRLKAVRDGLEDWEMLMLAERVADPKAVRKIVSKIYTKFGAFPSPRRYDPSDPPWSLNPDSLLAVRQEVAGLILGRGKE